MPISDHIRGVLFASKPLDLEGLNFSTNVIVDINQTFNNRHKHVCEFIGLCANNSNQSSTNMDTYLVYEVCSRGSLEDILENENIDLPWYFRYSLAHDVASGVSFIHNSSLSSHGLITPAHCVIDNRWTLKLTDVGLHVLRKQESVTTDYNITALQSKFIFSAPELLLQGLDIYLWNSPNGTKEGDMWSLGMVFVMIANRGYPFEGYLESSEKILTALCPQLPMYGPKPTSRQQKASKAIEAGESTDSGIKSSSVGLSRSVSKDSTASKKSSTLSKKGNSSRDSTKERGGCTPGTAMVVRAAYEK